MTRYFVVVLGGLAGCPSGNAPTVWLANDRVETEVKLVESEPPPF